MAVLGGLRSLVGERAAAAGDVLAAIDFRDGGRVLVRATAPGSRGARELVLLSLALQGPAATLRVGLFPPRVGGCELVLGSGIDREDQRRPDDDRVVVQSRPRPLVNSSCRCRCRSRGTCAPR
ncbi:MAG: hypothetical protein U0168_26400 [Nannocystaceae bacterium]